MGSRPLTLFLLVSAILAYNYLRKAQLPRAGGGGSPLPTPPDPLAKILRPVDVARLAFLESFARGLGLRITSTTGGLHNTGSAHYEGRAIDVSVRGLAEDWIAKVKEAAAAVGIAVRDERQRPAGQQVWSGPHLHLEVP